MMKRLAVAIVIVIVSGFIIPLAAGEYSEEDCQFVRGLLGRRYYDLAIEMAKKIEKSLTTPKEIKAKACRLLVKINDIMGKRLREQKYKDEANRLREECRRKYPALLKETERELLQKKVEAAIDLANQAEVETDKKQKKELRDKAIAIFKELATKWKELIEKYRRECHALPKSTKWKDIEKRNRVELERILDAVFRRDHAEYLYANSFIAYAKLLSGKEKEKALETAIKKFEIFLDGEQPEDIKGRRPPPPPPPGISEEEMKRHGWVREKKEGEEKLLEPRFAFPGIGYLVRIGLAQAYKELARMKKAPDKELLEKANLQLDFVKDASVPSGNEENKAGILQVVDVRIQAYTLSAIIYNLLKEWGDAKQTVETLLLLSGTEIQPDSAVMKEHADPEMKYMPDIRKKPMGKFAVFELATALTELKDYGRAICEVYQIYRLEEAEEAKTGVASPLKVNAARRMSEMAEKATVIDFPVCHCLAVAKGFSYREEGEKAVLAYKRALGADGTPAEKARCVPEALFALGKALMLLERYYQAAVVFEELCLSYPKYENISYVGSLLLQAVRKHRKESEFDERWYGELRGLVESVGPGGTERLNNRINDASNWLVNRQYKEAIEILETITQMYKETVEGQEIERPYSRYGLARAMLANCHYKLFQQIVWRKREKEEDKSLSDEERKKAKEHLLAASKFAKEALNYGKKDMQAVSKATYYFAKALLQPKFYEEEEMKKNAAVAIDILKGYYKKFSDKNYAKPYLADALAEQARAYFFMEKYETMHKVFVFLEKEFKGTLSQRKAAFEFYKTVIEKAEELEDVGDIEAAGTVFERAAYYLRSWYAAKKGRKIEQLLWTVGEAAKAHDYKFGEEVLKDCLKKIPKGERTIEEKDLANMVKAKMAELRIARGEYEKAAEVLEFLLALARCPKCGHEMTSKGRVPPSCPECEKRFHIVQKMKWVNREILSIRENAAKAYYKLHLQSKSMVALDNAQRHYHEMFSRLPEGSEKRWEVTAKIFEISFLKREYGYIGGQIEIGMVTLGADPKNLTEENWKKFCPFRRWRKKIKEIYEKAKEKTK